MVLNGEADQVGERPTTMRQDNFGPVDSKRQKS